jgi:hypothetical protein
MPDGEAALTEDVRKVSGFEFARAQTYERLYHGDKLSRDLLTAGRRTGCAAARGLTARRSAGSRITGASWKPRWKRPMSC